MRIPFLVLAFLFCSVPIVGTEPASHAEPYRDKNGFFEVVPPAGWQKREFNDPRSKVEFFVPAPVARQSRAFLVLLDPSALQSC